MAQYESGAAPIGIDIPPCQEGRTTMRRLLVLAAASLMLSSAQVSFAGGDANSEAFVDPSSIAGGANGFTNIISTGGSSSGKSKGGKCLLQVQFKGITGYADGTQLICIAEADVRASALPAGLYGNSIVLRGAFKSGGVKMKADLKKVACGSADAIAINGYITCYAPDADYTNTDDGAPGTNWEEACLAAGMVPIANPSLSPVDPGPAKDALLGLCQGLGANLGQRINPPPTGIVAEQGQSNPQF